MSLSCKVSSRLSPELDEKFQMYCLENGLSNSQAIRELIYNKVTEKEAKDDSEIENECWRVTDGIRSRHEGLLKKLFG